METVFKVRVAGPLAGWAEGFHAELMALGYAPRSAQTHLLLMRRLSRWLDRAGLEPAGLTTERIQEFLEDCHRDGVRFPKSMSGIRPLVGFLRRHDVIPSAAPEARIGVDVLIDQFRRFLVSERGLADGTIVNYVHAARLLLGSVGVDDFDRLRSLTALDVQSFVLGESARRSVASTKCLVTGLRSLLRFFHVAGLTDGPLAGAVPTVSGWAATWLPRSIDSNVVQAMLAACDRQSPRGRRDYAVLLLLARVGLRISEVAAADLDDIDWRHGELLVRGKAARLERLPLPVDVGEALADYVGHARPSIDDRALFVTVLAPPHRLTTSAVIAIAASAFRRAGIDPIRAHRLRHTIATGLLASGAGLPEIGQLLRHRSMASTAIYTSVDLASLGELARAWPQGGAK